MCNTANFQPLIETLDVEQGDLNKRAAEIIQQAARRCAETKTKIRNRFIGMSNEALSVVAMRVCNPNCSSLGIDG
jgi:hypothetical protein